MPKLSKTIVLTAISVAVGGAIYAKFGSTPVKNMLNKVA